MERLLFVWDELDDWSGIARHYLTSLTAGMSFNAVPVDSLSVLCCLPLMLF